MKYLNRIAIVTFLMTLCMVSTAWSTTVLYDRTFTGAELNDEVTAGYAFYEAVDESTVTGTRLDLSPISYGGDPAVVLFRMKILEDEELDDYVNLVVTVTIHRVMLTGDNDFGIAVSDTVNAIGGMQGNQPTNWSIDSPDYGDYLSGEDWTPAGGLASNEPMTYVIDVADSVGSSQVEAINDTGDSVVHWPLQPLNYENEIHFLIVGNHGPEKYGIKSVSIKAEADADADSDDDEDSEDDDSDSDNDNDEDSDSEDD